MYGEVVAKVGMLVVYVGNVDVVATGGIDVLGELGYEVVVVVVGGPLNAQFGSYALFLYSGTYVSL